MSPRKANIHISKTTSNPLTDTDKIEKTKIIKHDIIICSYCKIHYQEIIVNNILRRFELNNYAIIQNKFLYDWLSFTIMLKITIVKNVTENLMMKY
jgi:hypothetical protein